MNNDEACELESTLMDLDIFSTFYGATEGALSYETAMYDIGVLDGASRASYANILLQEELKFLLDVALRWWD